jgi:hypothetical protein
MAFPRFASPDRCSTADACARENRRAQFSWHMGIRGSEREVKRRGLLERLKILQAILVSCPGNESQNSDSTPPHPPFHPAWGEMG